MEDFSINAIRVSEMSDFKDDPDKENLHNEINWEKTRELQSMPKYKRFREWCVANGVFNPSVEYPVAFGKHGHLVGMCAARDVPPMTAFLYIPWELLINGPNIRKRSPELGALFDQHPDILTKHLNADYL